MRKFHSLTIAEIREETADSLRVFLDVPKRLEDEFKFLPGQHLPVQTRIDGKIIRRTYSICSAPGTLPLEIGIRIQQGGCFSEFVQTSLKRGDTLEVMPPFGQFHANVDADAGNYTMAVAAGSGITPVLSIIRSILECQADSRIVLFYGNRRKNSTMFIDDLYALKNRFSERLQLYFLFTQEEQEFPIFDGRLDGRKISELMGVFCERQMPDETYICGPDTMIDSVTRSLVEKGVSENNIHAERYGAPRAVVSEQRANLRERDQQHTVTVILDGHRTSFGMSIDDGNIVDAAASQGIELPYSCKGGVCATCRTLVREGEVAMKTNYGLESWEVDKGYVLACQSCPVTDHVVLDYDKT